jgi:hypothetical protein
MQADLNVRPHCERGPDVGPPLIASAKRRSGIVNLADCETIFGNFLWRRKGLTALMTFKHCR